MSSFDYLIVGAGLSGSVCAERLAHAGKHVLIVERRNHIGGNCYDEYNEADILVHRYGAHCFHTNSREVFDYLSQFTEWRPYEHRVLSQTSRGLLPVPINQTTLAAFGGDLEAAQREMIEPYTRKQWGPYADQLLPSVLARVAPRDNRDDRYFTDTYQAMPKHGYTRMFEQMLAHPNIHVLLKTTYREAAQMMREPYYDPMCGEGPRGARVIYTGSIDEFFGYQDGRLPYRSAAWEHETWLGQGGRDSRETDAHGSVAIRPYSEIPIDDALEWPTRRAFLPAGRARRGVAAQMSGVVNYPAEWDASTRRIEWKILTGQQHPRTTVTCEYPRECGPYDEPLWPVPTVASVALYHDYRVRAEMLDVHFLGRLGRYQYLDMGDAVAQALALSAELLANRKEPICQ